MRDDALDGRSSKLPKEGEILRGTVMSIKEFGFFVKLDKYVKHGILL